MRKNIMNSARAPSFITHLLRNMAARPDESISRPTNRKRSWKAPDKGSSKDETTKDALLGGPRDNSILQIDGSVLEGVGHVRPDDWIILPLIVALGGPDTAQCGGSQLRTV